MNPRTSRGLRIALLPAALALLAVTAGCAAAPAEVAALSPSAAAPAPTETPAPVPGSTSTPAPGSWDGVEIPAGLSLVVVPSADDPGTASAIAAIESYAAAHDATVTVARGADLERMLLDSAATGPDAVITLGPAGLDAIDRVSASNLAVPFLLIGAQLPEPTDNVAAVIWPGGDSRASDGGVAGSLAEHAASAVSLGIAAVVEGRTGTVFDLGA